MDLKLPLLGDVMTEGTLVEWFQPAGAHVAEGAPLYRLETDKVNVTVDAPESGELEQIVQAGETVPVGTLVGRLSLSGSGAVESPRVSSEVAEAPQPAGEVRASPAARRLAEQLGVDLSLLGTGRRIREADVQAYAATRQAAPSPNGAQLSGRRKVIAERMRASLQTTAQLTISMEVDMSAAVELRKQLRQLLAPEHQPTITDLIIRAAALALREHPQLNATLEGDRLIVRDETHVGVAVDADEGLIVPVIRNADRLALTALAAATRQLAQHARDNQLQFEDVQGATFTVTSLGPLGVDFFTPIINPPQVAILGIGRLFGKLVLADGRPVERQAMYLNLSFDHQAVDGAPAARFLQAVKRRLELSASLML